jgi:Domain of unknown function (DUF4157)
VLPNPALSRSGVGLVRAFSSSFFRGRTWLLATLVFVGLARADDLPEVPRRASGLSPAVVQTLAPVLADWITRSRDAAVQQGVAEIPPNIRAMLAGYVPDAILDRVRWRTGGADGMSIQQNVFAFGEAPAVTLDYVIVFAEEKAALEDPKLWAHELRHVMQFNDWGVAGFATRYLRDYEAVEGEAAEYRWQFMKLKGLIPPPSGATDTADTPR